MTHPLRQGMRVLFLLLRFLPVYLREMTLSNFRVALDSLRPQPRFVPGFLELDLNGYSDLQRWGAACLISMTPGTLSLDLDEKSNQLLVHSLYLSDPDAAKRELERLLESAFGKPHLSP